MFCKLSYSFLLLCCSVVFGNMNLVNDGFFYMGQTKGVDDEIPVHRVYVSSFFIAKLEVSIREWVIVANWALANGYDFSVGQHFPRPGPTWFDMSDTDEFPMNSISWYDAVKWCNAKSQMEGRVPCYYLEESKTTIYRFGEVNLNFSNVLWQASGYRLPTEAEWEKAARGKYSGYNYPWGNEIDGSMANYKNSNDPFELGSGGTSPVGYYDGNQTIDANVDFDITNNVNYYGLFDVVGNVSEWCWDWYDQKWYNKLKSRNNDTAGPHYTEATTQVNSDSALQVKTKVHRGGAYNMGIYDNGKPLRTAYRHVEYPSKGQYNIGLRFVRSDVEDVLWLGAKSYENFPNWYLLPWFGYYYRNESQWVFHSAFGWIYPIGKGSYDNWLYFPKHGWLWTCRYTYPYFYSNLDSTWYKYDFGNTSVGWFINSLTEEKHRFGRDHE